MKNAAKGAPFAAWLPGALGIREFVIQELGPLSKHRTFFAPPPILIQACVAALAPPPIGYAMLADGSPLP
jgi:hypothetical protein